MQSGQQRILRFTITRFCEIRAFLAILAQQAHLREWIATVASAIERPFFSGPSIDSAVLNSSQREALAITIRMNCERGLTKDVTG